MTRLRTALALVLIAAWSARGAASGPVGFYGIVERVVFEPDDRNPERVQVWGAFAYFAEWADTASPVARGYLYFRLPNTGSPETARREWSDLRAVAGTGQAVAFGAYGSSGNVAELRPDVRSSNPALFEGGSNVLPDLRVRPATEPPTNPAAYQVNAGVVKLSPTGSNGAIVKRLQDALR